MRVMIITESQGKLKPWHGFASKRELEPISLMTAGYVHLYPEDLDLLGFRFKDRRVQEFGRLPNGEFLKRLPRDLRRLPSDGVILIATDDDREGDVIAFDVIEAIRAHDASLLSRTLRVHPKTMTYADMRVAVLEAIEEAHEDAQRAPDGVCRLYEKMKQAAVPGRARAILDRLFGSAYSNDSGAHCGRVKAAALGAVRLWNKTPEALLYIPETGEVRLRVAAADGGEAFTARVALRGRVPDVLARLAKRHNETEVPGLIHVPKSVGAAVAPRDGRLPFLNTADALIVASRHHDVKVLNGMKGLETGYAEGTISYPRTAQRHISVASARKVADIAQRCGVPSLPVSEWAEFVPSDGAHEALHPAHRVPPNDIAEHFAKKQRANRSVTKKMTGIVSERSFEAMRHNPLTWGRYRPVPGSQLLPDEIALLEGLEWTRSEAEPLHKAPPAGTKLTPWSPESIIMDILMSQQLGRPSSWAKHAHAVANSGWVTFYEDGRPPTLSQAGEQILSLLPREAADPETSRTIERILDEQPDEWEPDESVPLEQSVMTKIGMVLDTILEISERLQIEMVRDDVRMHDAFCRRADAQRRIDAANEKAARAEKRLTDAAKAKAKAKATGVKRSAAKILKEAKKIKEFREALKLAKEKAKKEEQEAMLVDAAVELGLIGAESASNDAAAENPDNTVASNTCADAKTACKPREVQKYKMNFAVLDDLAEIVLPELADVLTAAVGDAEQASDGERGTDEPRPDQQMPEPREPEPPESDPHGPDAQEPDPPGSDGRALAAPTDREREAAPSARDSGPCPDAAAVNTQCDDAPGERNSEPQEPDSTEAAGRVEQNREAAEQRGDTPPLESQESEVPDLDAQEPEPPGPEPQEPDSTEAAGRIEQSREAAEQPGDTPPLESRESEVPGLDAQEPEPRDPKPPESDPHGPDAQELDPPGSNGRALAAPMDHEREAAPPARDSGPCPDSAAVNAQCDDAPGEQDSEPSAPNPDSPPGMAVAAAQDDGAPQPETQWPTPQNLDLLRPLPQELNLPSEEHRKSDRRERAAEILPEDIDTVAARVEPKCPDPHLRHMPDGGFEVAIADAAAAAQQDWESESRDDPPTEAQDDWAGTAPQDLAGTADGQPEAANGLPNAHESSGIAVDDSDGADIPEIQERQHHQTEDRHDQNLETRQLGAAPPNPWERQARSLPEQTPHAQTLGALEPDAQGAHPQEMSGRAPKPPARTPRPPDQAPPESDPHGPDAQEPDLPGSDGRALAAPTDHEREAAPSAWDSGPCPDAAAVNAQCDDAPSEQDSEPSAPDLDSLPGVAEATEQDDGTPQPETQWPTPQNLDILRPLPQELNLPSEEHRKSDRRERAAEILPEDIDTVAARVDMECPDPHLRHTPDGVFVVAVADAPAAGPLAPDPDAPLGMAEAAVRDDGAPQPETQWPTSQNLGLSRSLPQELNPPGQEQRESDRRERTAEILPEDVDTVAAQVEPERLDPHLRRMPDGGFEVAIADAAAAAQQDWESESRDDPPTEAQDGWAGTAPQDLAGTANGQPEAVNVPPNAHETPGIAIDDSDGADIPEIQERQHHQTEDRHDQNLETRQLGAAPPNPWERQARSLPEQTPHAQTLGALEPDAQGAHPQEMSGRAPKPPARTPRPPDQAPPTRPADAPEPDAQGAHWQETDGRAPRDAAAHDHDAEPVGHVVRDMAPVESGFVTERLFDNGGRPVVVLEFYDHDGIIEFMEARNDAGNIEQLKYDKHTYTLQPVAPGDKSADPRMRWRARRPRPKPPEPDYDDDYDYDDDCCPDMDM